MKRTFKYIFALLISAVTFTSCDEDSISQIFGEGDTVAALKEALSIGAEAASNELGKEGGYLQDSLVRIAMPAEANAIFDVVNSLNKSDAGKVVLKALNIDDKLESTMTTLINRAAEDAAPKAVNVFKSAITNMSMNDGKNILFGANNAATSYLHDNTFSSLQSAFNPTISASLSNVSFGGYDANEAWEAVSNIYNKISDYKSSTAGTFAMGALKIADSNTYNKVNSIQAVNTNLADYVTGKALDGLFSKVANKELDIRTNAASRTSDLLKRVFGQLDEQ
ncbi:MAG: DUF4197 domain-containing protein [Paludibacteraceae bacterium]|nr:DUF4197 domain-containing protein [Paludibacteraceae bacterium]